MTFKVNFLCQKLTEFFRFLSFFKNSNLGDHFLQKIFSVSLPSKAVNAYMNPYVQYCIYADVLSLWMGQKKSKIMLT